MKRTAVPYETDLLRYRPAPRLEQQDQPLQNPICSSRRPSRLDFNARPLTDAFDFALNWPACQVLSFDGENWEEAESACSRDSLPNAPLGDREADFNRQEAKDSITNNYPLKPKDTISLSMNMNRHSGGGNGRMGKPVHLPHEIMAMIISQILAAPPNCAINVVVPDWNVCQRKMPEINKRSRATRIVTYTRGTGCQVSTLSHKFAHEEKDHILTPMAAEFDPSAFALNVQFHSEYISQFYRNNTHIFTLGISDRPSEADNARNQWTSLITLRNQRIETVLPFDDEPINGVEISGHDTIPIYQHLRHIAVHSPLDLMQMNAESLDLTGYTGHNRETEALNTSLDLDRSAHLWLSWSMMPNLESVFLDLRIYSHDSNTQRRCLSKFQIMDRAREMGCHLRLGLLVLAGLQSYSFHTIYEGVTARDIEEWDLIDDEPNWIKVFKPAIRRGGKIVLVDRLVDEL